MNVKLLFYCACYRRSCLDCPLDEFGCEEAPEDLLLKAARENYVRMKNSKDFDLYNTGMVELFGADYAKEFMVKKATVC